MSGRVAALEPVVGGTWRPRELLERAIEETYARGLGGARAIVVVDVRAAGVAPVSPPPPPPEGSTAWNDAVRRILTEAPDAVDADLGLTDDAGE